MNENTDPRIIKIAISRLEKKLAKLNLSKVKESEIARLMSFGWTRENAEVGAKSRLWNDKANLRDLIALYTDYLEDPIAK